MQRGAALVFTPDPERPTFRCLSPEARQALQLLLDPDVKPAAQALMRHVAAYRTTLLELFRLNGTEGTEAGRRTGPQLVAEEATPAGQPRPCARPMPCGPRWPPTTSKAPGCCPLCGGTPHATE